MIMREFSFNPSSTGSRIAASEPRVRQADPIEEVNAAVRSVLTGRGDDASRQSRDAEVFAGKLLALRHAEALPSTSREIRIAPGTVVTPLARNLLKQRGIVLRIVSRGEFEASRPKGDWGFEIVVESVSGTVAVWQQALLEQSWLEVDSVERWVAGNPDRGALLVTDDAAVAVWRACQRAGVRAASAVDPESVARAVRRLGANLLVIEPGGKPIAFLKQMSLTFRHAGAPRVPDGLRLTAEGPGCELPR
jgi:hypothetical protein